jgi:hypothetical protein
MSPTAPKPSRADWAYVALFALWIAGMILPPTLEPAHRDMIQIVALLWPAPLFLLRGTNQFVIGLAYRQSSALRYLTVVFVTAITISSALSINQTASFRYAAATISGFILCAGVWSCLKWRMQQALVAYAILSSGFCLYTYFRGESVWGRLTFGAMGHPNYLALVAFGALVCSLAVPFWTLRILLIAINGVVILETQARSCSTRQNMSGLKKSADRQFPDH